MSETGNGDSSAPDTPVRQTDSPADSAATPSDKPSTPATPAAEPASPATPAAATPSTPGGSENGEARRGPSVLRQQFGAFAKYGDTKSDGSAITLSQSDKWMKQAKVIDGRTVTTTDTAIAFKKFKQQKIHFKEFQKFLEELGTSKKVAPGKMKEKLANCGPPGHKSNASPGTKSNVYDRLCDVSKYGASHRLRFDEHGKGRGAPGRKDIHTDSGYVHGYKNQNTYQKQH
ncbi:tubulin polymerization-promoting protein homolog [Amphibalanus amphitrite]|uniref:tubulin polymerization-promoting protein homolog n=1 Tax=Amphibalanus amphitrite TaxID=1232801 RepID=UPI001C92383E|nr:tubulin polymerization-promoting protein homolog [Amphibalanus amphitrite]